MTYTSPAAAENGLLGAVLSRFEGVKQRGDQYKVRCPAHEDQEASLSITLGRDGRILLKCFAGCDWRDITRAAGLKEADLFPPTSKQRSSQPAAQSRNGHHPSNGNGKPAAPPVNERMAPPEERATIVATYDYHDAAGKLLFQVVRYQPKGFKQRRPDGQGNWVWGLGEGWYNRKWGRDWYRVKKQTDADHCPETGAKWFASCEPVLFRLPEVLAAIRRGQRVYPVEGEKDAEELIRLGLCATTAPMGANKWRPSYTATLSGAHLCFIPDNDTPGLEHVQAAAADCFPVAGSVRVLNLAEARSLDVLPLPPKGDVFDWLRLGGTRTLLERLADGVPPWTVPPAGGDDDEEPSQRFPHTDLGNAERLIDRHGKDLRYLAAASEWCVWDGTRWGRDADGEIVRRAIETVRAINEEIKAEKDNNHRNWLVRHQQNSEGAKKIESMIKLAKSLPGIPVKHSDLDSDHWALNLKNGTVDLRSGLLRPHQREDLHTLRIELEYDPDAECPTWLRFLREVMDGDQELVEYLQRAIGYTISGTIREHAFWIHHGRGRNGKSTFLDIVRALLGPYAETAAFDTFLNNRNRSGPRDDLADLAGKRMVSASESPEGCRLDEAVIKQITGGDPIRARALHKAGFVYQPTYKIHLAANHLPHIRGDDEGIWQRIHRVPWLVSFASKPDLTLPAKLRAELPGVLRWAVQGCLDWQQGGLQPPKGVLDAVADYRKDMDVVSLFLSECCVNALGARIAASDLYLAYKNWTEQVGERPLTSRQFNERLRSRGVRETLPNHKLHFHDLGLLDTRQGEETACDGTERGGRGGRGGDSSNSAHAGWSESLHVTSPTSPHDMTSCNRQPEESLFDSPVVEETEGPTWYQS